MKYDVAVIGAGPAGATAARFLSQNGLTVALVEKEELPRDKPCGGALSLQHLKRFKYLKNKRDVIGGCLSYGVEVHSPSLETVAGYTYSEPQFLLVLRNKFDQVLVDLALDSGSELRTNTVKDVIVTPNGVNIKVDDGHVIKSELAVGADGVNSLVGKKTGLNSSWKKKQVVICAVNEALVGESVVEKHVGSQRPLHILSFNDFFGYGWLFPKREHLNVGIGGPLSLTKGNISNMYVRLVRILKEKKLIPKNFQKSRFKAYIAPISGIIRKPYGDRVMLCGDAAGCSNPLNGEGIYYAMASGQIAAETILKALEQGDVSSTGLSGYRTALMEDFGYDHETALNLQRQAMISWPLMEYAVGLARADEYLLMKAIDHGLGKISTSQFLLESGARFPISCLKYAMQGLNCKR